jgi:hypothetical protein
MNLRELEAIAEREFLKHDLHNSSFGWARAKRRQGACNYRPKRIEIAEYYVSHNPPEKVLDTLLHEIAHAHAHALALANPWPESSPRLSLEGRGKEARSYATCL